MAIINNTQLTTKLIRDIPPPIVEELELLEEYIDDNYLVEANFILCEVEFANKKYSLVHGFPGDNPSGIFYSGDRIVAKVGECVEHETKLQKWYYDITNGLMNFDAFELTA